MQKGMISVLLLLFICIMSTICFAEDDMIYSNPVNPWQAEVWHRERQLKSSLSKTITSNIEAVRTKDPKVGDYGEWTVTYDTTHGNVVQLNCGVQMMDEFKEDGLWRFIYMNPNVPFEQGQQIVSSCKFVTGGYYFIEIIAVYEDGTRGIINDYFSIEESGKTSLEKKVDEIVAGCRGETQWETALNLHDWLITNLYYDQSYQFYGADGLLRGYGVCDTYSKAYWMLCKAAGIPVGRVKNISHAWNVIQLDGKWYFVDTTWDDPTGGDSGPVSGGERRFYFCLSEEALSQDHPGLFNYEDGEVSCTALEMNYYIRSGDWRGWELLESSYSKTPVKTAVINAFDNGNWNAEYTIPNDARISLKYLNGSSRANSDKLALKIVLAYALEQEPLEMSDGNSIFVKAEYLPVVLRMSRWAIEETGKLILPSGLKEILSNAFTNTGATTVIISEGCERIGSQAFSSSMVRMLVIPDSVVEIAGDAFENCEKIIFKTANPFAVSYAADHGMVVLED